MKVKGTITISRVQSSHEDDYIEVRLIDEDAAIAFAETKIGMKEWGDAVSGRGYVPVEIEIRGLDKIGTHYESKTEIVPYTKLAFSNAEKLAAIRAMKKFEVEGWRGDESDLFNHHRLRDQGIAVTFRRNVSK